VLALCAGLAVRWGAAVASAIALLGAEQAVRLARGPEALDAWAQRGAALWRVATVLLACAGGGIVSALVVIAAGLPIHGGFGLELAGVIAATAALAVVAAVARAAVR
jgi:hypothetical protein